MFSAFHGQWDQALPFILAGEYRITLCRATGFTLAKLFLGRIFVYTYIAVLRSKGQMIRSNKTSELNT